MERLENRELLTADLVADINTRSTGQGIAEFVEFNDAQYFLADEAVWRFDPATKTSELAFPENDAISNHAREIVGEFQDQLLIQTQPVPNDGEFLQTINLWLSDGTAAGTRSIVALDGPRGATIEVMAMTPEKIHYVAPFSQQTYWTTDGTEDGVVQIDTDFNLDRSWQLDGETILVSTRDGKLFASDGTPEGLQMLVEQNANFSDNLLTPDGQLLFVAWTEETGTEPWITDGTQAGTRMLIDASPGPAFSDLGELHAREDGSVLLSLETTGRGYEPWITRGTTETTELLVELAAGGQSSNPFGFWSNGNTTYFAASDGSASTVWATDGTEETTRQVSTSEGFTAFGNIGERTIFGSSRKMWATAGSVETTVALGLNVPSLRRAQKLVFGDSLVFSSNDDVVGNELAVTDGTVEGTRLLDLAEGPMGSDPDNFKILDGQLFFSADFGNGFQLTTSDLTLEGTEQFVFLNADTEDSDPRPIGRLPNGVVIVSATRNRDDGEKVWAVSPDGSLQLLIDDRGFEQITAYGDRLIFATRLGDYITDGTLEGTRQLSVDVDDESNIEVGGSLYFRTTFEGRIYLARLNARGEDFTLIKEIGERERFQLPLLTQFKDQVVFTANDALRGQELWITNGSPEGTRLFAELNAGPESSGFRDIAAQGDDLFAVVRTGENFASDRLYVSVGGTEAFKPLAADVLASNLFPGENVLYFFGQDEQSGSELWRSDGTEAGTFRVQDINPNGDSAPFLIRALEIEGTLYFEAADDGDTSNRQVFTSRGELDDVQKVGSLLESQTNRLQLRAWNGRILVFDDGFFYESRGKTNDAEQVPFQDGLTLEGGTSFLVPATNGFLTVLSAKEVGREPFLLQPSVKSNPQVTSFSHTLATDDDSIATVSFTFNVDVSDSLTPQDLLIMEANVVGRPIDTSTAALLWDADTNSATWDLLESGLDVGAYTLELGRLGIYDKNNNALDGDGDGVNGDRYHTTISTALPGDIDLNGKVEFADFLILSANFGSHGATYAEGDIDGDQQVNFADFLLLSGNFGR